MNDAKDMLRRAGEALHGHHWQVTLAKTLRVNARTMRRWLEDGTSVPGWVWAELAPLLEQRRRELAEVQRDMLHYAP